MSFMLLFNSLSKIAKACDWSLQQCSIETVGSLVICCGWDAFTDYSNRAIQAVTLTCLSRDILLQIFMSRGMLAGTYGIGLYVLLALPMASTRKPKASSFLWSSMFRPSKT